MKCRILYILLLLTSLLACQNNKEDKTLETHILLSNLESTTLKGIMFGHHDDTVYGIGWEGNEDSSDVKSVCGGYPAVISFDLGEIELGKKENLDKVSFDKIRSEIIKHYQRDGVVSLSWHVRNPLTGGDSWDVSDSTVVSPILELQVLQHQVQRKGYFLWLHTKPLNLLTDFLN